MKKSYLFFIILIFAVSFVMSGCSKDQEVKKLPDIPEVEKIQKILDDISAAIIANSPDKIAADFSEGCPGRQLELDKLKGFAANTKLKNYSQSILSAKRLKDGVVCTISISYEGAAEETNVSKQTVRDVYFIFENGVWRIGDYSYFPYSNPTVIVGSDSIIYDAAYLMSETLNSELRNDTEHLQAYGDVILVGTPYDNASILDLEEKGLTLAKVSEDYPGNDTGIVQVLSNVENYRHVLIVQGSSAKTAENAARFMAGYLKDNPYVNPGVYFIVEDSLKKASPLELTTLVTLDMGKTETHIKEVIGQMGANIEVIDQELQFEKEQLLREQSYLHNRYMEDYSKVFSRYEFYPEQSLYDSMILINANLMDKDLCTAAFKLPGRNKIGTAYTFADYANRSMNLSEKVAADNGGILIGGSSARTHIAREANGSVNALEASSMSTALLRLAGFSSSEVFNITTKDSNAVYFNIDNGYAVIPGGSVLYTPELQHPAVELLSIYNDTAFLSHKDNNTNLDNEEISAIYDREKKLFRMSGRLSKKMPEKVPFRKSELTDRLDLQNGTEDIYSLLRNTYISDSAVNSFSTLDEARDKLRSEMGNLLAVKSMRFIINAASRYPASQYDYASYGAGLINVEYPGAYAKAAEESKQLNEIGSGISNLLSDNPAKIQKIIDVLTEIEDDERASDTFFHPDYCIVRKSGSHWDKALLAFGLYSHLMGGSEDTYIALGENSSYLVFKEEDQWKYLDCKYNIVKDYIDDVVNVAFNKDFVYNKALNIGDIPEFEK